MFALHKTGGRQAKNDGESMRGANPAADGRETGRDVDAAIARVLQAEQAARERVAACERDAVAIVQQAREQARRIAARAARRTARVHARVSAALAARLADIEARRPSAAGGAEPATPGDPRIAAVAERLARELTGRDR
jgi:vacuolar-type H+-ATPase subunit H